MNRNYHSHTFRCGHATGNDEDYVIAALNAKMKTIGFADHVFLPFLSQPGMRGDISLLDDYVSSIEGLRKHYEGRIQILKGFECEYMDARTRDYYLNLLNSGKIDYLILGEHGCVVDGYWYWYAWMADKDLALQLYTQNVISAMETGLFSYVAHPDVFISWYGSFDEKAQKAAFSIIKKAKELNVPLEINMGRKRYAQSSFAILNDPSLSYPYGPFWKMVAEIGCDTILGIDAHNPMDYADSAIASFENFAKSLGLHPLEELNLRKPK